ncbi:DNA endonuclease SmrA [Balneatrix alpica]|uniref:DNA endonuclease SmrA n=1 Tax=Balneatrix alpica TaxID=75684 RepID=A0ABV5Z7M6_9GAMM|nr:DNA endonuclease SmrA [Balneatrix alpica]
MARQGQIEPNFADLMQDVQPLKTKEKVWQHAPVEQGPGVEQRRLAAQAALQQELDEEFVELLDPYDELSFKRPGIQQGVYRQLRQGKYPYEARLDLYRMSIADARREVKRFLDDCLKYEIRSVLIAFGRGTTPESPAVWLKSYVAKWLAARTEVQAYHSAIHPHGGLGAVYVLLRKSEQARLHTLERHQRRLG